MTSLPLAGGDAPAASEGGSRESSAPASAAVNAPRGSLVARTVRDRRVVGVAVVVFTLLLQATNHYLSGHEAARVLTHLSFLAVEVPSVLVALSLTYTALKKRRVGSLTALGVTVAVAGSLGAAFGVVLWAISRQYPNVLLRPVPAFTVARGMLYGFSLGQFHMGLWALAFAYPFAIDEARVKDLEAQQLRSAAELARLRAHLEPHFLLNTLNAIAGLVTEEPREARRLIGCLGDLLRDALHEDDELQSLHAQVAWLQRYAAILQARHAGSLAFEWNVASDCQSVLLPRLLLQPLVENAVKHGALRRHGGGMVSLRVRWTEDASTLECLVEDNGPGAPPGEVRAGAIGLKSTMRRVELKYPGSKVALENITGDDGTPAGLRARVQIARQALDLSAGRPS